MTATHKDILIAARNYLSDEKRWFNAKTRRVTGDINRHCIYTAIVNEYYNVHNKPARFEELEGIVHTAFGLKGFGDLWRLNDHLTHEQMLELMDMGINNVQ